MVQILVALFNHLVKYGFASHHQPMKKQSIITLSLTLCSAILLHAGEPPKPYTGLPKCFLNPGPEFVPIPKPRIKTATVVNPRLFIIMRKA